jgi:hypothetical protein
VDLDRNSLLNIIKLRIAVGYLGEAHQSAWWQSQFFMPISASFLNPVFGRMAFAARYYGVKEAALRVHDEYIGVGKGVYHLFRLPEMFEKQFHQLIEKKETSDETNLIIVNRESAIDFLRQLALSQDGVSGIGPVIVGNILDINNASKWCVIAACYLKAFQGETKIFPYFAEVR